MVTVEIWFDIAKQFLINMGNYISRFRYYCFVICLILNVSMNSMGTISLN